GRLSCETKVNFALSRPHVGVAGGLAFPGLFINETSLASFPCFRRLRKLATRCCRWHSRVSPWGAQVPRVQRDRETLTGFLDETSNKSPSDWTTAIPTNSCFHAGSAAPAARRA